MKNARIENSHSNEDASADIKDSGGIDITMYNSDIFAEGEMGYGTHMCIEVVSGDPLADEFKTKENQHSRMMATMDGSRSSMKFETKIQEPEVKKAKNEGDSIQEINEEIFHDAQCSIDDSVKDDTGTNDENHYETRSSFKGFSNDVKLTKVSFERSNISL